MNSTLSKITAITAISAAAIFGLAACSTGASSDQGSDTDTIQLVGPVVVEVATLDGTTVMVNEGQMIDITTGDLDPAAFTAAIADTNIATFTAGGPDGSATFNPGITGVASGTTKVALTDTVTGTVYNFTVTVTTTID